MVGAMALGGGTPLRRAGFGHGRVQIPVADTPSEMRAHSLRNHRMHHIEGRDAAGAGDAVPIENEPRLPGREVAEGLFQHRRMLPVNGEIAVFQQSRRRQHISAAGNAPIRTPCRASRLNVP